MLVVTVGMNIVAGSHATAYSAAAILMCTSENLITDLTELEA